jgi:hypothetical protein
MSDQDERFDLEGQDPPVRRFPEQNWCSISEREDVQRDEAIQSYWEEIEERDAAEDDGADLNE